MDEGHANASRPDAVTALLWRPKRRRAPGDSESASSDDSNLLAAEARAAIGDRARGSRLLRTVYGFGYAFSGEIREERPAADAHLQSHFSLAREEEEIALAPGDNVLGRDPSASVRIDDDTVSRRHARITVTSRDATIEDLGSKNGTFAEGRRTGGKPLSLADGDQIQVGSVFLAFRVRSSEKSTRTFRGRRRP